MTGKEFLDAVCGKPIKFNVTPDVVVTLKALTYKDILELKDENDAGLLLLQVGVIEPSLTKEEWLQCPPNIIKKITEKLYQLSGLEETSDF